LIVRTSSLSRQQIEKPKVSWHPRDLAKSEILLRHPHWWLKLLSRSV
jgi:hypothetical protein